MEAPGLLLRLLFFTEADDVIDETVGLSVLGGHKAIAVGIFFDGLECLARVVSHDFVQAFFSAKNFLSLDADIGGLALGAAEGLMDHDPRVGQAVPFAFGARGEKDSSHASGLADAVGIHLAGDVLHGVINSEASGDITTRRVDIDTDVLLWVFHLEEEELGDDGIGHGVINGGADKDDAVFKEPGVDVVGAFATAGLFNDARYEIVSPRCVVHSYDLAPNGVLQKKINRFSAQESVSK